MAVTNVQAFSGDVEISSNLEVGTANLFVDTVNSRVGIGVTSPDSKLEVRGNIQASSTDTNHGLFLQSDGTLRRDGGGYGAGFHFTNVAIWATDYLGNYSAGGIDFGSSSYRWNNIWTEALNTNGDITCTSNIYFGSGVRQHINLHGSLYGIGVQSYTTYFRSYGNFIFYQGGSHNDNEGNAGGGTEIANFNRNGWTYLRQNVQITGNVGIGTTNPACKLDVNGEIRGDYDTNTTSYFGRAAVGYCGHNDYMAVSHIDSNDSVGYALLQYSDGTTILNSASGQNIYFREANADRMVLKNGKFGIGITNPLCPLDVANPVSGTVDVNDDYDGYYLTWSGVSQFQNSGSWNVAINADTLADAIVAHTFVAGFSINFLSDRRIKKDIKEIDDSSALEKFRLIKPSKYKYIEPMLSGRPDKEVYGFIAQEVAEVLPESVTIGEAHEGTNQGRIPNIMSMCRIESQSISSDAYKILDPEQKGEYTETGNTYTRQIVTITKTIDLDTFSITDSTPKYKISEQTKTTGAFDKNSDGEYHPLIFYTKNFKTIRAHVVRVIDDSSFVVDTNLLDVDKFKNDELLLYGQKPNDFHRLNKDAIFTLASAALQEVDRQLQAEKAKVATLETQVADLLARVQTLESA